MSLLIEKQNKKISLDLLFTGGQLTDCDAVSAPSHHSLLLNTKATITEAMTERSQRTEEAEAVVSQVFGLYEELGKADYIGEAVTQLQHALQAAHLAEKEGFPVQASEQQRCWLAVKVA